MASLALGHRIARLSQFSSIAGDSPDRVYLVDFGIRPAGPQLFPRVGLSWVPHRLLKLLKHRPLPLHRRPPRRLLLLLHRQHR